MSKALITESILTDIADAIIEKDGASAALRPTEMPDAIRSIGVKYTATIIGSYNSSDFYVKAGNTNYYTTNDTFTFVSGQTLQFCSQNNARLYVNGVQVDSGQTIDYTAPSNNISIELTNPAFRVVTEGQKEYIATIRSGDAAYENNSWVCLYGDGGERYCETGLKFNYFSGQDFEFTSNVPMNLYVDGTKTNPVSSTSIHYTAPQDGDKHIDIYIYSDRFEVFTVKRYVATITEEVPGYYCWFAYYGTSIASTYGESTTFEFIPKDKLECHAYGAQSAQIYIDDVSVASGAQGSGAYYEFILPENDISIRVIEGNDAYVYINNPTVTYNANDTYVLPGFGKVIVAV